MKIPKFEDYKEQISSLENEGYKVVEKISRDYGLSLGLVVEKNGKESIVMFRECYYDTNENGERTVFHGVVDIRGKEFCE